MERMATKSENYVKDILVGAYGKENVFDDKFEIDQDIIYYSSLTPYRKKDETRLYSNQNQMEKYRKLIEHTREGKKSFIFYKVEGIEDAIFSAELCDVSSDDISHVELPDKARLQEKLRISSEKIIRLKTNEKIFFVAIKIGQDSNRDFTALKNYIVSSDNRTYNKVIRNMVEYIEVEGKKVPQNKTKLSHNLLVSGAPGTGKSYFLSKKVLEAGKTIIDEIVKMDSSDIDSKIKERTVQKAYCDKYITRVTFYEDYSYENFIGCYKPIPKESCAKVKYNGVDGEISEEKITYDYVSGPFIDTYINAKKDSEHNFFIIIEEINRAKAASVFGEMFQLLDRDKNGVSDYEIKPDAALNTYLAKELGEKYDGFMKLPHNMYIWATMNSADQGVMPLDSAFKRRWTSMYMDINASSCGYEICIQKSPTEVGTILWDNLRKKINDIILSKGFDEDRCIGPWYFSESEINEINNYYISDEANEIQNEECAYYLSSEKERLVKVNPLIDKLFFYLRQDVFRRNPTAIFNDKKNGITMSDLRRRVRQGESIETILNLGETELPWLSVKNINTLIINQETNDEESKNNAPSEV